MKKYWVSKGVDYIRLSLVGSTDPSLLCSLVYRKYWEKNKKQNRKQKRLRWLGSLLLGFWIRFTNEKYSHNVILKKRKERASIVHKVMVNRHMGFSKWQKWFSQQFLRFPTTNCTIWYHRMLKSALKQFYFYLCSPSSSIKLVSLLASVLNHVFP